MMKEPPEKVERSDPPNPGEDISSNAVTDSVTAESAANEMANGFGHGSDATADDLPVGIEEVLIVRAASGCTIDTIDEGSNDAPILKARLEAHDDEGNTLAVSPPLSVAFSPIMTLPPDVLTPPLDSPPTVDVKESTIATDVDGLQEPTPPDNVMIKLEPNDGATVDVSLENMLTLGDRIKMTERSRFGRLRKKRCLSPSLANTFAVAAAPKPKRPKNASLSPAKLSSTKNRRRTPAKPTQPAMVEPDEEPLKPLVLFKTDALSAKSSTSNPATQKQPSATTIKATPRKRQRKPTATSTSTATSGKSSDVDISATIEEVVKSGTDLSITTTDNSKPITAVIPKSPNPIKLKWLQGDVVWYKVQGQPWWPAKVACDPASGFCTKMKVNFHTMYYLSPFGERDGAEWVSSCQILTFRGREKFMQYVESILSRFDANSNFFDRTHTKFHVPESKRDAWEAAIMEADVAIQVAAALEDTLDKMAGFPGTTPTRKKRKSIKLSRHEVTLFAGERNNGSMSSKIISEAESEPPINKSKKIKKNLSTEFDKAKPTTKEARAAKPNVHPLPKVLKTTMPTTLSKHIKKLAVGAAVSATKKLVAKAAATVASKGARPRPFDGCTQNGTLAKLPAPPKFCRSKGSVSASLIFTPPKERIRIRRKKSVEPAPTTKVNGQTAKIAVPSAKKRLSLVNSNCDEAGKISSSSNKPAPPKVKSTVIKKEVVSAPAHVAEPSLTGDKKRKPKSLGVKGVPLESGLNSGDSDSATESCPLAKKDFVPEGKNEKICQVCEKVISTAMVALRCDGVCMSLVHVSCANPTPTTSPPEGFKCEECISGVHSCFVCKRKGEGEMETRKCGVYRCGKFYHDACLLPFRSTKMEGRSMTCSLHSCLSCVLRNNRSKAAKGRLIRCLRCPVAFHNSESCLPAGSSVLSSTAMVCPMHYRPKKSSKNLHINVNWCFVCSTGGSLICCETCPASFHAECLNIVPPEGSYYCAECTAGTQPKYGDIVWVKLGVYRWWPAKICSPRNVPPNIQNLPHTLGEFPVHFFGTKDYYWTSRSRVFQFLEGDQSAQDSSSNRLGKMFKKALQDALQAFHEWKIARETREAQDNERDSSKLPVYKHIKVNKPVGKATVPTVDPSQMTPCECDPNSENPCGSDSECLNRMLMFECHPDMCRAGSRCQNRRFEMQQYCPAEPFKAEGKGWGLKSLVEIKKGDFVNEYVGEIIDEEECRQRMKRMHEENNTSYYFLTIDKDRIIDAARKGNLSRFMNHSCQPNCETHKWTVNGEKRVGLFAVRHIPVGTELTFNYNLDCLGNEKTTCKCGAPNCSGFIGERPKNNLAKGKKLDKLVVGKKKRRRVRKLKPEVAVHDDECFRCGQDGELLMCDRKNCTKTYHLSCLDLAKPPHGRWECPWHHCDTCGRRATVLCFVCPNSYCKIHSVDNIHQMPDGNVCCRDHLDADLNRSNPQKGIDSALLQWLTEQRSKKIPVSGTALQRRAEEISLQLGLPQSESVVDVEWLRRFRVRNTVACHELCRPQPPAAVNADVGSEEEERRTTADEDDSEAEAVFTTSGNEAADGVSTNVMPPLPPPLDDWMEGEEEDDLEMGEGGVTECIAVLRRFVTGNDAVPDDVRRSVRRLETFIASLFSPPVAIKELTGKSKSGANKRLTKMAATLVTSNCKPVTGVNPTVAELAIAAILPSSLMEVAAVAPEELVQHPIDSVELPVGAPIGRLKMKVKLNGVTHHAEVIQTEAAKRQRINVGVERRAPPTRRKKRVYSSRKRKPRVTKVKVAVLGPSAQTPAGLVSELDDNAANAQVTSPPGGTLVCEENVTPTDDVHVMSALESSDAPAMVVADVKVSGECIGNFTNEASGTACIVGALENGIDGHEEVTSAGDVDVPPKRRTVPAVKRRRARVHRVRRQRKPMPKTLAVVPLVEDVAADHEPLANGDALLFASVVEDEVTRDGCNPVSLSNEASVLSATSACDKSILRNDAGDDDTATWNGGETTNLVLR